MIERRHVKHLENYFQYVRKNRSWIFVTIMKVLIVCSIILLLSNKFSNSHCIQNGIQELPKFKLVYKKEGSNEIRFKLEHCNCERKIIPLMNAVNLTSERNGESREILTNETTCSSDAYLRGVGQKVVSYSFYGDIHTSESKKKGYFEGIAGNLELMSTYYPGWVMRVYYDLDDNDPITQELCDLACKSSILDLCYVRSLPGLPRADASTMFPMVWRFFPTLDEQVDVFVSRDLDTRFNAREAAAVKEWRENSHYSIHTMRDHPYHNIGILGGAWGADLTRNVTASNGKNISARQEWKITWKKMLTDKKIHSERHRKGPDQDLLTRQVWNPWGYKNAIQHDAYTCENFENSVGWPTKRPSEPNNFMGAVLKENNQITEKCPIKCRRNQNWEYC